MTTEEIARLRAYIADAQAHGGVGVTMRIELAVALLEGLERAREVLREVEWKGGYVAGNPCVAESYEVGVCPSCEGYEEAGHQPDCALRRVLGGGG